MTAPDHPDPSKKTDPLDDLLDRWEQAPPPAPGSVAPEVWRRIHQSEQADTHAGAAQGWLERMYVAFGRTSFAAAFVAACVLLGLFLAEVRSSRMQAAYGAQLAQSYVRLIDPLLGEAEARPALQP